MKEIISSLEKSKDATKVCWIDLVQAISTSSLKKCNLSFNHLGSEKVKILAQALHNNTTLINLELSHNDMGNQGFSHIIDMLQQNTTLTSLNLMGNEITDKYYTQLVDVLNLHGNILQLKLDFPSLNQQRELTKIFAQNKDKSSKKLGQEVNKQKKPLEELHDIELENYSLKKKVEELEKDFKQLDLNYQNLNFVYIDTKNALNVAKLIELKDDFSRIKSESPLIEEYIKLRTKNTRKAPSKIGPYYHLGKGGFSDIVLVEWHYQLVAMKRIKTDITEDKVQQIHRLFLAEASLMVKLCAPNIINCYAVSTTSLNMFMLVELMDCDMYHLLQHKDDTEKYDIDPSWNEDGINFASQIISGLRYLHSRGVIHKDLKSPNCLIKNRTVKITDFGISAIYNPKEDMVSHQFTVETSSPEMLNRKPISFTTDIFSLGIILWELYHWEPAWPNRKDINIEKIIMDDKIAEVHPCKDEQIGKLVKDCWNISPQARPSIDSVYETLRKITK